ncbi:hypothetical protein PCASD_13727 [Puccinia coronata f. sp. avenae]|uniref:Uncharacterized protein n=1 Tax=Puccinia coronata f. sp. avenae TaxID=200324 RepID=A0A2N5TB37_9BASI|nr:hypothetical protein PCASD_13727 [Puccinia coronata f. sp. avenae]
MSPSDHPHPLSPTRLSISPSSNSDHTAATIISTITTTTSGSSSTSNSTTHQQHPHGFIQVDYPPKSPDELPSQAATRLLLSSPHSQTHAQSLPQHSHTLELTTIPLHLPKPKPSIHPHPHRPADLSADHQASLLAHFSEECRKMFYTGDAIATKNVESIIKNLPAASKATYTKQMATVRSQFHRDAASSRRAEVDKLLLDTLPSSIIIKAVGNDSSLAAMRSPRARQERLDRLKKFMNAHCVRNMVGVHPFFNSLCAVLHLMSLPARKSGSGKRRVEWEIDLALFCEAGGEPFLVDSIQFLKGVLGFEDHLKPLVASSLRTSFATSTNTYDAEESEDEDGALELVIGHEDGDDGLTLEERQELEVDTGELEALQGEGPFADSSSTFVEESYGQARGLKGKMTPKARDRALSDPFLDPAPPARPSPQRFVATAAASSLEQASPRITVSPPATDEQTEHSSCSMALDASAPAAELHPRIPSNTTTTPLDHHHHQQQPHHRRSPTQNSLDAPPPTETRIFRSPSYLTTPELRELISLFPSFITVRTRPLKFDRHGTLDSSSALNSSSSSARADAASRSRLRPSRSSPLSADYSDDSTSSPSPISSSSTNTFAGHGVIRVSVFEKDPGWKGSFIERIKMFFFRFFNL